MKALISIFGILAFSFCVLVIMCGTIRPPEIDKSSRAYRAWLEERALNEYKTQREWTR
jgi:hypothetical protein